MIQEKSTLQSTVYEHLNTISLLKSQLESVKHLSSSKPADPSRVEQLTEQLNVVKDALDRKEQEVCLLAILVFQLTFSCNIVMERWCF